MISTSTKVGAMMMVALLAVVIAVLSLGPARPAQAITPEETFTVDQTIDTPDPSPGDGDCDVSPLLLGFQCTLRAAIQEANATTQPDLIRFSIEGGASRVKTINVGGAGFGALPTITEPVIIDGYTQAGASPNTRAVGDDAKLTIELNGANAGSNAAGLFIGGAAGNCVIKGLVINNFSTRGIAIGGDTFNNRIEGNFIGTDPTGTLDRGNGLEGVLLFDVAGQNVVGGTTPAARNVISGNGFPGISTSRGADANTIQGNYIGTDRSGTKKLGNSDNGIQIESSSNIIGGTTAGARNVVSGNANAGVALLSPGEKNRVLGNRIGTTAGGTGALGNLDGVAINGSSGNAIGDGTAGGSNTIAFNETTGVRVDDGNGLAKLNRITHNSIFSNDGLGIDLNGDGITANDPGDADSGPNNLQNFPVLTFAKSSSTRTTIAGKLNSAPGETFKIEFFSNPSGNEGKKFIGQKSVTTDAGGNATFTFNPASTVSVGQTATATATNKGNTSEFSAPKTVALASGSALAPDTTKLSGPSDVTKSPTAHFKFASPDPDATFECSLDGGAYYECSSPENIHGLSEGRHTVSVRALDEKGNVDASPAAWIWTVDRNK